MQIKRTFHWIQFRMKVSTNVYVIIDWCHVNMTWVKLRHTVFPTAFQKGKEMNRNKTHISYQDLCIRIWGKVVLWHSSKTCFPIGAHERNLQHDHTFSLLPYLTGTHELIILYSTNVPIYLIIHSTPRDSNKEKKKNQNVLWLYEGSLKR